MNISLTPELEKYIQEKVQGGMYTSASEVIRESLRIMHIHDDLQRQRVAQLNQAIEAGLTQLDQHQAIEGTTSHANMKVKLNKIKKGKA